MKVFGVMLMVLAGSLANPPPSVAAENAPSATISKVRAYFPQGRVTTGSAVLVAAERLVTNCHVTETSQDVSVIHDGRIWPAQVTARDTFRDLCILKVPGITGTEARSSKSVAVGQRVFAAGFFGRNAQAITEGRVVALHDFDGAKVIQVSAPFETGASGGGLFDEQGQLIGILTFKARIGGAFHFALPVEWVNHVGRPNSESNAAETSAFWQQAPEQQPFFLRAMSLEVNQKWDALADLGEHWIKKSPMNPHAWTALETAFRNLRRLDDSLFAGRNAQRLSPAPRQELVQVRNDLEGDRESNNTP